MITIVIQVDAPPDSAQAVKETLGMYMERFGDTRVVDIREDVPQQMTFGMTRNGSASAKNQRRQ